MRVIIAIFLMKILKFGSKNLKRSLISGLCELLKYDIRQLTINYSQKKKKSQSRKAKVKELEVKLQNCTNNCEIDTSKENVEVLDCLQAEYDDLYDYISQGAIVCSRVNWYEKGEKKITSTF